MNLKEIDLKTRNCMWIMIQQLEKRVLDLEKLVENLLNEKK